MSGSSSENSFFDIHEKLRELYVYLYLKDIQDTQVDNRVSFMRFIIELQNVELLKKKTRIEIVCVNVYFWVQTISFDEINEFIRI